MGKSESSPTLAQKIESLTEIPANEQCIGHLQMALKNILLSLAEDQATLRRQLLELVLALSGGGEPETECLLRLRDELKSDVERKKL